MLLWLSCGARAAYAESEPASVAERFNNLHRAKGIVIGGVEVRPSFTLESGYDSNVLQSADGDGSALLGLRGSVEAQLRSGIYTFEAGAAAARMWDVDTPSIGGFEGALRASVAVELSNLNLRASAGLTETVERPRNNGIVVDGAFEPYAGLPKLRRMPVGIEADYRIGALTLAASARSEAVDAEPLRTRSGTIVAQDFRSGWESALRVRGTYGFHPQLDVFLEGTANLNRYDVAEADTDTWRAVVGGHFNITRLVLVEVSGGVAEQVLANGATASGFVYGARALWFAHELLTLSAEAERGLGAETEQAGGATFAVPVTFDTFRLRAEFEPLRTLMVFAESSYETGERGGREETFVTLAAGASYHFAPRLRLDAEIEHLIANSNFSGDFARTQFNLGVTAAY